MKRIDYFWPRATMEITSILFVSQALVECIGIRKTGYEWVFPLCAILFIASFIWVLFAIVWNAIRARGQA